MALITAEGIAVYAGNNRLLHDVDLQIEAGEIVTLIGPNGAGKSTLLKALIGALPIRAGRIEKRAGLRIGYTPQKIQLEKTMPIPVQRFLALSGRLPKGARAEVLEKPTLRIYVMRRCPIYPAVNFNVFCWHAHYCENRIC